MSAIAQQGFRGAIAWVFVGAIVCVVVDYGAVSPAPLNFAAITFASFAIISILLPIRSLHVGRLQAVAVLLVAGLVGYAAFQALPLADASFANPAWKSVTENVGPVQGTISVAPGMTLDALSSLALPFLAFIAALAIFQGDEEALWLWRALTYFGTAYAVFGILQDQLFPKQLLFGPKKYSIGALTATFVNRNTTATFLGIALLLNLGLVFYELRKIRASIFISKAFNFSIGWRDREALLLFHVFSCFTCSIALFLTQSRGGVAATFVACVSFACLAATGRLTADEPSGEFVSWRRYAALAGVLFIIVGAFAQFAGRPIYRMETGGTDDARWCIFASAVEAIRDNWVVGTGLGTFQDVFPMYRNSDCAGIFGVWERAHNVFLEGFLSLGLPFLVALCIGYLVLGGVFIRGIWTRRKFRSLPAAGFGVLILASLHSNVDFSLQIPGVGIYFAAAMASAITVSLGRPGEQSSPDKRKTSHKTK